MKRLLLLSAVLLLSETAVWCQSDPFKAAGDNQSGVHPFGSYDHGAFDSIDLSNGALTLTVNFAVMTARGHESRYSFMYSSKVWSPSMIFDGTGFVLSWQVERTMFGMETGGKPNAAGWRDTRRRLSYLVSKAKCIVNGIPKTVNLKTNYVYTDEDGAKHNFPNWEWSSGQNYASWCGISPDGYHTGYSSDGTGMRLTTGSGSTVKLKSGVTLSGFGPPTSSNIIVLGDPNGNSWSAVKAANGQEFIQLVTDVTQRVNAVKVLDTAGIWQTYNVTYGNAYPTATFQNPAPSSLSGKVMSVATQISMPNGRNFTFEYAGAAGELSKVTLPTGGYVRYEYTTIAKSAWTVDPGPYAADARYVTKRAVSPDGNPASEQIWTYTYTRTDPNNPSSPLTTRVNRPDGSYEIHSFVRNLQEPYRETQVEWHEASGALLKKIINAWTCDFNGFQGLPAYSWSSDADIGDFELPAYDMGNCRVTAVTAVLDDGQQSQVTYTHDSFSYVDSNGASISTTRMNVKKKEETAFGQGAPGSVVRVTKWKYLYEQNSAYLGPYLIDRLYAKWVGTPTNTYSLAESLYDTTTPTGLRGNQSVARAALLLAGAPNPDDPPESSVSAWRDTTKWYDTYGNLTQTTDPAQHTTTFEYNQCNFGYLSAINYAVTGLREEKTWNCNIGAIATTKDVNLQVNSLDYNDPMHRLTRVSYPDGGYVTFSYNDVTRVVEGRQLIKSSPVAEFVAQHAFDGLARLSQARLASDPTGTVMTDTVYDTVGRVATTSNPYRSMGEATYGVSTNNYDALDRITKVIPPDGSVSSNNVTTTYQGNCTTVTDQAGKKRKSCVDALGRLVQVFEPDAGGNFVYETDYLYDVLNNLVRVDQKGNDSNPANWRTRTFAYNSLSQLTSTTNPETGPIGSSGTMSYAYDNDGNLLTKTDARGTTTCFGNWTGTSCDGSVGYDPLHRLLKKAYSNGDPAVTYSYDQSSCLGQPTCSNTGRRTGMTDAVGSEAWSYDVMGRVLTDRRTTNAITKDTLYTYNPDGSVATLTYSSGRTITYSYGTAARPTSAVDSANGINYAVNAQYGPQGALSFVQNGASLYSTFLFNKRLQPCWTYATTSSTGSPMTCTQTGVATAAVLDFQYDYGLGVVDNGNVNKITNRRNTARSVTYTYDELNRIKSAVTDATSGQFCWGQLFGEMVGGNYVSGYDAWANLKKIAPDPSRPGCAVNTLAFTIGNTNKITDPGYQYDGAGNMTADPGTSASYQYDAESRLKSASGTLGSAAYLYDGDGRRVAKAPISQPTQPNKIYWYGMGSDALDESDGAGAITDEYIFFDGRRIARRHVNTPSPDTFFYYFADQLGTARVVTDSAGTVLDDSDFYPFGGERVVTSSSGNVYKFTGKERDAESGLDDFGARYYSSSLGRWLSPDWSAIPAPVPYADLGNPQTLNLYAYVANNPTNGIDPEGHFRLDIPLSKFTNTEEKASFGPGDEAPDPAELELEAQQRQSQQPQQQDTAQNQNQGAGQSTGTASFNLSGATVTFSWATYTEPQGRGVEIEATVKGCDGCVWAQTVSGPDIKGGVKADIQPGADPKQYPFTGGGTHPNDLYDRPERSSAPASLNFVSTMGVPTGKTFDVKGSLTWGFSVNKSGQVRFSGVRVSTPAEQRGSLLIWRRATGMETGP